MEEVSKTKLRKRIRGMYFSIDIRFVLFEYFIAGSFSV